MTYATLENLITRYSYNTIVQLTDRADQPTGEPDATVATVALEDATEVVNSYVAARYAVPLTPVPEPVRRITCDIARFYLYTDGAPEEVRKAYEDAIAYLKDIAKGTVTLQAEGVPTGAPQATEGTVSVEGSPRIFSHTGMWGY